MSPQYEYQCPTCGWREVVFRSIQRRNAAHLCKDRCGLTTRLVELPAKRRDMTVAVSNKSEDI